MVLPKPSANRFKYTDVMVLEFIVAAVILFISACNSGEVKPTDETNPIVNFNIYQSYLPADRFKRTNQQEISIITQWPEMKFHLV